MLLSGIQSRRDGFPKSGKIWALDSRLKRAGVTLKNFLVNLRVRVRVEFDGDNIPATKL